MYARLIGRRLRPLQQVRSFAGGHGHGHQEQYTGMEATIRKYLPGNHEIVLATLGAWAAFILLMRLTRSSPKPKVEDATPVKSTAGGAAAKEDIPSMFSEKFDKWSKVPGNMEKWEKSLPKWEKQMEDPKYAAAYSKS